MPESAILFFKKTYKIIAVFVLAISFFFFYNTYLVDRSLINLKVALNKAAQAQTIEDFAKIKPLLKIPLLDEVSKRSLASRDLMSIEFTDNIISSPKSMEQLEDIKYYLRSLIKAKEEGKGNFLAAINRLNSYIYAPRVKLSQKELEAQEKKLLARAQSTQDKGLLQNIYYELGNIYVQLEALPKAEEAFNQAIKIDPASAIGIKSKFNLAWAYKSFGNFKQAIALFEELAKQFPEKELAIAGQFQAADVFYKKGEYIESRNRYAQVSENNPKFKVSDLGLYQAGYISLFDLNDKEAALVYFTKLMQAYPDTSITRHMLSTAREVIIKDFRRRGYKLLKEKKYDEAVDVFKKAVEISPSDAGSISGIGLAFYWQDKKDDALNKAKDTEEVKSIDEQALINVLFIYINSQKNDEAIRLGERVRSKLKIKRAEFYYNLAYAYILKGQIEEAITCLERAVSIKPDFVFANNNLGCCLWWSKKYSDSIRLFKECITIDSGYLDAHFNLGVAHFYTNRLLDSSAEFQEVLKRDPKNKEAEAYLRRIKEMLDYQP